MWLQPVGSCAGRPAGPQQVRVSDLDRDMAVLLLRGCLLVQVLFFAEMCPFGWTVENLLISLVTVATVPFSLWVYLLVVLVPISFYFADLWLLVSCFPFSEARA